MWHQKYAAPAPFHQIELFSLVEPVAESEGEITFAHRLYMVAPFAESGRLLLRQLPAHTLQKALLLAGPGKVA
ncbi:hypothetical protein [Rhodobacter sp. 24-YEA-8]|uniref:hypothetical protein n=1 Tax=Rhodobacter sp. 24-YEA-8 TaxID=1884310 RepID=UPI000895A9B2|nr:hypothetical protein [Rhodobacter sp. 24-YEA-8]SEC27657.1 hypothetical protein SAMN05519105_2270 [Rhodobacter sp. 24-YEA-8]